MPNPDPAPWMVAAASEEAEEVTFIAPRSKQQRAEYVAKHAAIIAKHHAEAQPPEIMWRCDPAFRGRVPQEPQQQSAEAIAGEMCDLLKEWRNTKFFNDEEEWQQWARDLGSRVDDATDKWDEHAAQPPSEQQSAEEIAARADQAASNAHDAVMHRGQSWNQKMKERMAVRREVIAAEIRPLVERARMAESQEQQRDELIDKLEIQIADLTDRLRKAEATIQSLRSALGETK